MFSASHVQEVEPPSPADEFSALMDIAPRPPIVFVEGRGSWLVDRDGRRYLDFVQGWAVNALGHCPPAVVAAVARQAASLINCSPAYYNRPMVRLAQMITELSGLDQVFLANSGAEANEGAIKLARKWGAVEKDGAFEIITLDHGFHGRTLATMSASGKAQWDGLFEPKVSGFPKARINDLASVEALIGPKTVAVMVEPIQGEAGVVMAEDDFLRGLRDLANSRKILLILDEIQTGIGRTGTMFGFQQAGVKPDIMTLAKGLGGGVPLAALVADKTVCCFSHGDQGGTFCGNPLTAAAGLAVLKEVSKPGFLDRVMTAGALLRDRLETLSAKHGGLGVQGRGLLLALNLGRDIAKAVVAKAEEQGLLLNAPRPHLLRFMPALTVTDAEIERMAGQLDRILAGF
jgi:acetylornithine/N-succinyldiaminopimelate aminotransferase